MNGKIKDLNRVSRLKGWVTLILMLCLVLGLVAAAWANFSFLYGRGFDPGFAMGWYATRGLLMEGISPYDPGLFRSANQAFASELNGGAALAFTAPVYALIIYLPFALLADFAWASAAWMLVLQVAAVLLVLVWIRLANWSVPIWLKLLLAVLGLVWLPTTQALISGGVTLLVFFCLSITLLALQAGKDEFAAVFFVFAAIQLQILLLGLLLVLVWAFSHRRWRFINWVLGTWVVLCVIGFFFVPNWIMQNIWVIVPDFQYEFSGTLRSIVAAWFPGIGQQISRGVAYLLLILLGLEWWQAWKKPLSWLGWTLALTLVVSIWLSGWAFSQHVVVTLAGMMLIGAYLEKRWSRIGRALLLLFSTGLSASVWALYIWAPERRPSLFFFVIPLTILLGLYWIRWWLARSVRLNLLEDLGS